MTALSKHLALLAIFLLACYANAFLCLSQVAGNQVQVNYWFDLKKVTIKISNWIENQPMIKQQMKINLHLLSSPLICLRKSMASTPLISLRQSMVSTPNHLMQSMNWFAIMIKLEWTFELRSVTSGMMRSRARVLLSVILDQKEVWHVHALFSFHLSVLLAHNWSLRFTLIRSLWKVLQSVGYSTIKI